MLIIYSSLDNHHKILIIRSFDKIQYRYGKLHISNTVSPIHPNRVFRLLVAAKNNIKVRERFVPLRNNIITKQAGSERLSEWQEEKGEIVRFLEERCQFSSPSKTD